MLIDISFHKNILNHIFVQEVYIYGRYTYIYILSIGIPKKMPFPAFPAPGGYAWGDFIKFGGALQLLHMRGQGWGF
jgi:hypothetical protein